MLLTSLGEQWCAGQGRRLKGDGGDGRHGKAFERVCGAHVGRGQVAGKARLLIGGSGAVVAAVRVGVLGRAGWL